MADQSNSSMVSSYGKAGYVMMALLVVLVMATFSACTFGTVTGEELNPYSFARREFRYVEIPLLGIQVVPTTRTPMTSDLETWIVVQKKLLGTPGTGRWDLVQGRRAAWPPVVGDARVLTDYFDTADSKGIVWLKWSEQNARHAAALWPRVAWLAQQELYYHIPAVMDLAKQTDQTVEQFTTATDKLIEDNVRRSADRVRKAGDAQRADLLKSLADEQAWTAAPPDAGQGEDGSQQEGARDAGGGEEAPATAEAETPDDQ